YLLKDFKVINSLDDSIIKADWEKLYQVFFNLIENSFESTEPGGYVKIESVTNAGSINLIIKDNGKGIDPEYIEKIFEAFFTSKSSGTGLGLSICKKIIEQHSGTIQVTDSKLGFTVFEITLSIVENHSLKV
ncbi:MAG: ATP-binding protein, partial [Ignavibacteriae bacterium]|nr:ATP-binding protein [Ignavibacteriota bacterium]